MTTPIRVVLADDHKATRRVVRAIINGSGTVQIIGEAADGDAALELCRADPPDVLLADLHMEGTPAIQIVRELATSHPQIRVVILTAYEFPQLVADLVAAGIAGYIMKDDAPEELLPALRAAMDGKVYRSRSLTDSSKALFPPADPPPA